MLCKDIKTKKKEQVELTEIKKKSAMSKIKITLHVINGRVDITEEQ